MNGTPPFAHLACFGGTSLPLALKTSSVALAGSIPTEFGKLINVQTLYLYNNKLTGTPPFAQLTWFGSTSLPRALTTSSFALAGSIPTEFGELINLTYLNLEGDKLSGTPSLLILPGVVVRVYRLLKKTFHLRWQAKSPRVEPVYEVDLAQPRRQ